MTESTFRFLSLGINKRSAHHRIESSGAQSHNYQHLLISPGCLKVTGFVYVFFSKLLKEGKFEMREEGREGREREGDKDKKKN